MSRNGRRLDDLAGRHVCLLGYGRDGLAVHRALLDLTPSATVSVRDAKPVDVPADLAVASVVTGPDHLEGLDAFDVVVLSAGVRSAPQIEAVTDRLTTSTQIFFDSIRDSGATTIGITGSKGKSTTTNLIAAALRARYGDQVHVVGNIGVPMVSYIADAHPGAYFVCELSSYQLERLTTSPHIAVLTSLFPEHLDRHGSFAAYREAKTHIARHQQPGDLVVFNATSEDCTAMAAESPGEKVGVRPADFPVDIGATRLRGEHNLTNLAAAYLVAQRCGVPAADALSALCSTDGLPYRLRSLGVRDDIEWVDDSLATAPEPTIAALRAFGDRVDTLLVGGQNRGFDFAELGRVLAASDVRHVVLFPDSGVLIRDAIEAAGGHKTYLQTASMAEAVSFARQVTRPGGVCLLSTASPSYSIFRDHVDKSQQFAAAALGTN